MDRQGRSGRLARHRLFRDKRGVGVAVLSVKHQLVSDLSWWDEATSYGRHRFPPEVIRQAVWLYFKFTLSLRDVEEILAKRGIDVSYETVRCWAEKFGGAIAPNIRRAQVLSGISMQWSSASTGAACSCGGCRPGR